MSELRVEYRPLDEVVGHDRNPKRHHQDTIVASIVRFGFADPAVIDERTGVLAAGHGRLDALKTMRDRGDPLPAGIRADGDVWLVPLVVGWASADDVEAQAALVALNQTTVLGGWDDTALLELLEQLAAGPGLDGVGFDGATLTELRDRLAALDVPADDPDDAPPTPAVPQSRAGDVWTVGRHRLVVGDSTDPAVVAEATGGEQARLLFTDPPYGVAYQTGMTKDEARKRRRRVDGLEVSNDALSDDDTRNLLVAVLKAARPQMVDGACYYLCSPAGNTATTFRLALTEAGWPLRQVIVWVKDVFVMGRQDYHWRHEDILYGWVDGAAHWFGGGRTNDTVWEFPRPKRSKEHPTMKPVALVERAIRLSSHANDLVLDPFAGSGTTMVAAQIQGRRCAAVELDPAYADVIITRMHRLFDLTATRQDGTTWTP